MVVFTCNNCGESLHKPKVEKHYAFSCRSKKSLTCVDCFKDFRDDEYVVHIKCITEDERYAARGSIPNGIVKKGELKQESWIEMIKTILKDSPNLTPAYKSLLTTLIGYTNIPRKKNKFINFLRSSSGGRVDQRTIEGIWNIIEEQKLKENPNLNKTTIPYTTAKEPELDSMITNNIPDKEMDIEKRRFSFRNKIIEVINKYGSISASKLQRKTLNAYYLHTGQEADSLKSIKKYNKKLKKIDNIQIVGNKIQLQVV